MTNQESIASPAAGAVLELASHPAQPSGEFAAVAAAATTAAPERIELRGTRRSYKSMPRNVESIRGKVRLPRPRKDGAGTYLRQWILTAVPLLLTDVAVLGLAAAICHLAGLRWLNPNDPSSTVTVWFSSIALTYVLINSTLKLYPGVRLGLVEEIHRLTMSLAVVAIVTLARHRPSSEWFYHRFLFLAVAFAMCVFLAPICRSMIRKRLGRTSWWGFPTLVCGDDTAAFSVDRWLSDNRRLGLKPLGVIANPTVLELDRDSRFIGSWPEARRLAEEKHAFWAIIVEPEQTDQLQLGMTAEVEQYLGNVPHIFVVSKMTGVPDHWNRHQMDEGLAGFLIEQHLQLPIPQLVKRGMDVVIAVVAGILLLPVFAALAVATKFNSRGKVFYGHTRIGRGNTRFTAWKFRTMSPDADRLLNDYLDKHPELRQEWDRDHKLKNDPRVTSLGKWMRKYSIDELPQVWNVLRGEMSIVGPRPIVEAEVVKYGEHFETFSSVLPGMTGLWQVCGRNDTTYEERVQLDMYYVHHWSPWLDLYLLARTIKTVLFTRGAY